MPRPAKNRQSLTQQSSGRIARSLTTRRAPNSRRLNVELLEDRRLLAAVTVSNLADVVNGNTASIAALIASNGGDGVSLREAILAADADAAADVIDFSVTGTIQLTNVGHAGELAFANNLTINGPGAGLLTIRAFSGAVAAGDGARIFNISDGVLGTFKTVSINGLTLTGGDTSASGAAILSLENLGLTACAISGNTATGGVTQGGGVSSSFGSLAIVDTTISGNTAGRGGGVYSASSATVANSTISDNFATAAGGNGGGGIVVANNAANVTTITNSTISGNKANAHGGGILNASPNVAGLTVRHSTITGNRADADSASGGAGGGIYSNYATTSLDHTMVAGNLRQSSTRSDLAGGEAAARFSLIGDSTGATINAIVGNQIGTGASPINAKLAALANNGGPTQTHMPLLGSPAIEMGDSAALANSGTVPLLDQRGAPFARVADAEGNGTARIDIGAIELPLVPPNFVVDILTDEDDDNYAPGDLSLREAIRLAEFRSGVETITFAPALTAGGPATILLSLGELAIAGSMTIQGPGASLLTIDAKKLNRVFNIDDGSAETMRSVALSGLAMTGGMVDFQDHFQDQNTGGGISNHESLNLDRCLIFGNVFIDDPTNGGGGVYNAGNLTITASTIRNNSVQAFGSHPSSSGGGICNVGGNVIIRDSAIYANWADAVGGNGAGIFTKDGTVVVLNSTISGNDGAGIVNESGSFGSLVVRHSTITGNSITLGFPFGAGIRDQNGAILDHTIVAGNTRFISGSANVAEDQFGAMLAIYSLIGAGAEFLGPLSNNGGPTSTHALLSGSPAIDAGDPDIMAGVAGAPAFDQRGAGFSRVVGGRIDIGAFESGTPSADFDNDLDVDGFDFLTWQRNLGATPANAFHSTGNADYDADVDGADLAVWRSQFGQTSVAAAASAALVTSAPQSDSPNAAPAELAALDALYAAGDFTANLFPPAAPCRPLRRSALRRS